MKKYGAAIADNKRRRMDEIEFDQERRRLREAYGIDGGTAFRYEQELALLFYRSGLTQEQLARKEGISRPYATQRLTFGRFLTFVASGNISSTEAAPIDVANGNNASEETLLTDVANGNITSPEDHSITITTGNNTDTEALSTIITTGYISEDRITQ